MQLLPRVLGEEALVWIGVQDFGFGDPAVGDLGEALPRQTRPLAASPQGEVPVAYGFRSERLQSGHVAWDGVVVQVALDYPAQPLALLRDGRMAASHQRRLHRVQLGPQPLGRHQPPHDKPLLPDLLRADMREAEEVEGFRLALPTPLSILGGEPPELDQAGLVGMQSQAELAGKGDRLLCS